MSQAAQDVSDVELQKRLDGHLKTFYDAWYARQKEKHPAWEGGGVVGFGFVTPERARAMEVAGAALIIPDITGKLAAHVRATWTDRPELDCNPSPTNICLIAVSYS